MNFGQSLVSHVADLNLRTAAYETRQSSENFQKSSENVKKSSGS